MGLTVRHIVPPAPTPIHRNRATNRITIRCRRSASTSTRASASASVASASASASTSTFKRDFTLISGLERLLLASGPPPPAQPPSSPHGIRVAYQGARGSYCQEAAAAAFPSASAINPCAASMEAAFSAIEDGSADRAVIPLENSLDGSIPRNLDLLLRHPRVRISGELVLPVNHCLISHPAARLQSLRCVVSHPQALAHCRRRLEQLGLAVEEVPCAADAARLVAEDAIQDTAVIGSRMAAREYGLRVVEDNVQDGPNVTRFLHLHLQPHPAKLADTQGSLSGSLKCTVAFVLKKGPTDMFQAMSAFERRGVKVRRVDHRPNRARPVTVREGGSVCMDYVFVMDVEGRRAQVQDGIANLRHFAHSVRTLGRYSCAS